MVLSINEVVNNLEKDMWDGKPDVWVRRLYSNLLLIRTS